MLKAQVVVLSFFRTVAFILIDALQILVTGNLPRECLFQSKRIGV